MESPMQSKHRPSSALHQLQDEEYAAIQDHSRRIGVTQGLMSAASSLHHPQRGTRKKT